MNLEDLGWNNTLATELDQLDDPELRPLRVAVEHRGRYELLGETGAQWGVLSGRLRQNSTDLAQRAAVGDWVAAKLPGDGDAIIAHVLRRKSALVRRGAGRRTDAQVIVANVDTVFVVTSANADLNPRRIERYLTAVWDGGANPVVVVNKIDLCDNPEVTLAGLGEIAVTVPVLIISAIHATGLEALDEHLPPRATVALVGSSGVGKSTLVNVLLGHDRQEVRALREADGKGRHTTTRRELIALENGALLIDTPGMREFQPWGDDETALDATYEDIDRLALECKFRNCRHESEPQCAVRAAIASGDLGRARLAAFHKLGRELQLHGMQKTAAERHAHSTLAKLVNQANKERQRIRGK